MKQFVCICLAILVSQALANDDTPPEGTDTETKVVEANSEQDDIKLTEPDHSKNENMTGTKPSDRVLPDVEKSRNSALLDFFNNSQRQNEVTHISSTQAEFSGLFLKDRTGLPQGGVLLLHDQGQHANWPSLIAPLREMLPDYGWTTLAIELPYHLFPSSVKGASLMVPLGSLNDQPASVTSPQPNEPSTPITAPEPTAPNNPDSSNIDTVDIDTESDLMAEKVNVNDPSTGTASSDNKSDLLKGTQNAPTVALEQVPKFDDEMHLHIQAALEHLQYYGQLNNVIIAIGESAAPAVMYIEQEIAKQGALQGMSLILINIPPDASQDELIKALSSLNIPVLDIVLSEQKYDINQAKERLGAMKRRHQNAYQQIHMSYSHAEEHKIIRRIRGWLKTNASGTELP